MKKLLLAAALIASSFTTASSPFRDYNFEQERMLTAEDGIYIISSFEDCDKISAYSYYGERLWETRFQSKITSWEVVGTWIIAFSKNRHEDKTYLTCLDRYTGKIYWQRP